MRLKAIRDLFSVTMKGKIMAKQDLGKKRRCASCGMKFYDFNKAKIECPGCKTEFNPDNLLKSRKGRGSKQVEEKAASASAIDEKELLAENEDEADTDADDLGDDEAFADIPTSDNDDEEDAAILDDNMDEDFIDDIDEEGASEE